jgi:hypothetical protein
VAIPFILFGSKNAFAAAPVFARCRTARLTHGYYTAEMIELRRQCAEARRVARALLRAAT